jgi:hypothetical protein
VGFSALVLEGMDRWTVDSFVPRSEDILGVPDGVAEYGHRRGAGDIRGILELAERGDFYVPGKSSAERIALFKERCRLVLLRGLGTENARRLDRVGVRTVEELAAWERDALVAALSQLNEPGWRPRPRRVAIWILAARGEMERRS